MRREDRTASLETFRSDPKCHVLLASLKAACVGINLTCATRVFLFDLYVAFGAALNARGNGGLSLSLIAHTLLST